VLKSPSRKGQKPLGSIYLPERLFARFSAALRSRVHEAPLKKSDVVRNLIEQWTLRIETAERLSGNESKPLRT
jgi:hypothetical protein